MPWIKPKSQKAIAQIRVLANAYKYHHYNIGKTKTESLLTKDNDEEILIYKNYRHDEKKQIICEYYDAPEKKRKDILIKYGLSLQRFNQWKKEFIIIPKQKGVKVVALY